MSTPTGDDPERQLSSALRAQAAGNTGTAPGTGGAFSAGPRPAPSETARLPVLRVLLFALVLGLVAGVVAGLITVV